eukprot:SAG11_NODE_9524_length_903_cov_1.160448_1_plen_84_part_10
MTTLCGILLLTLLASSPVDAEATAAVAVPAECEAESSAAGCSREKFLPTTDWKEVLPGQSVPPECDVRIDLKTDKEYARLKPPV